MFLYHLTLQRPGGISQAVTGSFSAPKQQELVVARGDVLELLRPDESGKVQTILRRAPPPLGAGKPARRAGRPAQRGRNALGLATTATRAARQLPAADASATRARAAAHPCSAASALSRRFG